MLQRAHTSQATALVKRQLVFSEQRRSTELHPDYALTLSEPRAQTLTFTRFSSSFPEPGF